ncbi:MAG TPA: DUF2786 domain-containing protein [Egibacteraceae bacterium]|nr:DUF2786 domain-containing protein [Egibacteraceae bacterium]
MSRDRRRRWDTRRDREPSAERGRAQDASQAREGTAPPDIEDLLRAAMWSSARDPNGYEAALAALGDHGDAAAAALHRLLTEALDGLWRDGWTPADAVHVISRRLSAGHGDWAAGFVVEDSRSRERSGQALHPRWSAHLGALAERHGRDSARLGSADLRPGIEVLSLLARLPPIPATVPSPGAAAAVSFSARGLDERMLARVRALLAKAEATEFEDEAEALTAKAQELVARHAIDEALLHTASDVGEPSIRRIPVDDPYAGAKSSLLGQIAVANRCRVVYTPEFGWVTAFGWDHDLDAVELLAASLLAQATSAMVRHGSRRDAYGRSRTRSFRQSFLLGFAHRIGLRLREATDGQMAQSASDHERLLPVLSAREDRLRESVAAAFPRVVARSSAVSHAAGWEAGQAAAERADLRTPAAEARGITAS